VAASRSEADFQTIAAFRRYYRPAFREFVLMCRRLDLYDRELLALRLNPHQAVNNKDRNFTASSLREFIRDADERLNDYLERLDRSDAEHVTTGGGARIKNLEKIAACARSAAATR
jgi:hypothetical protein